MTTALLQPPRTLDVVRFSPVRYLTGVSTDATKAAKRPDLGLLATPASGVYTQRGEYDGGWAMDNGCYNERKPGVGKPFDEDKWFAKLAAAGPDNCLFVVLPDVLNWFEFPHPKKPGKTIWVPIGDAVATWERSEPYIEKVQAMGFPAAVVLQDGIEDHPAIVDEIILRADAVFVGGSDAFKLGPAAAAIVRRARDHGLWAHVGRVNSMKRMRYCARIGAHSADGTYVVFHPTKNYKTMIGWLDTLADEANEKEVQR